MTKLRPHLPLNALRAFESSARHLNFTRAGLELSVTQAAVSQQVRSLEERLGCTLFTRLPRGLGLTDEGRALLPVLSDAFSRIETVLKQFDGGRFREVLTLGVVGTFALGWLMPRLKQFGDTHPFVELRLRTNNNVVDLAAEGLDFAIRFGEGNWPATRNERLLDAPLTALCAPEIARRLARPADLANETLLRLEDGQRQWMSWSEWFDMNDVDRQKAQPQDITINSYPQIVQMTILGQGVSLGWRYMIDACIEAGLLVRVTEASASHGGGYYVISPNDRVQNQAARLFTRWLFEQAEQQTAP